jgi:hypothetical protein
MECQQGKKGGFVNFKTRMLDDDEKEDTTKKQQRVDIPDHLRSSLPDPHSGSYKKPREEMKSRTAYKSEADRLKAELAESQKQLEAKRAELLASRGGALKTSSALSAPPLSFKKRR